MAGCLCASARSPIQVTIVASCALPNTPPVSVSAADAPMTPQMALHLVRMAPLGLGEGFAGGGEEVHSDLVLRDVRSYSLSPGWIFHSSMCEISSPSDFLSIAPPVGHSSVSHSCSPFCALSKSDMWWKKDGEKGKTLLIWKKKKRGKKETKDKLKTKGKKREKEKALASLTVLHWFGQVLGASFEIVKGRSNRDRRLICCFFPLQFQIAHSQRYQKVARFFGEFFFDLQTHPGWVILSKLFEYS